MTLSDPEVRVSPNRERHIQAFAHIRDYFGDDRKVSAIWVPEIKEYIAFRQSQEAKGSTIGKEKSALSLMFKILTEHRIVSENPARMVNGPSDADGERDVYISYADFMKIVAHLPQVGAAYNSGPVLHRHAPRRGTGHGPREYRLGCPNY